MTKHDYGGQDRLIRITYPDGSRIDYRYDPAGNRSQILTAPPSAAVGFPPPLAGEGEGDILGQSWRVAA